MGEIASRSFDKMKPQNTAASLASLESMLGFKEELKAEKLQTKLDILDNLTDDLSQKFEKKIEEHAGGKIKTEALRDLAKTNPKAFAMQMSMVLDKVMADSEIRKILSKIELTNPDSLGKFDEYISDVKFNLNEKWTGFKSEVVDSRDDFLDGTKSLNNENFMALNPQGALALGATTGFAFLFCESKLGTTIKAAGIAAAIGSNDALAPFLLKTGQTALEGLGKTGKGFFGLLHETADVISSGRWAGLDRLSQAEKVEFYETVGNGVKHFPVHLQKIWNKILREQKGGTIESKETINDSDIKKSAYYVFSSLDQKMGQLEMIDFLSHVKERKTTPEKYRRFLLTTSAGGLADFFMNNEKYSEIFNKYLLEFKKDWENKEFRKFTEQDLKSPILFGMAVPQDASQERLDGIAGDFQLGASGMILKYLLIFYGLSVGTSKIISKISTIMTNKKNKEKETPRDKNLSKGEEKLQAALKKDYSDGNFDKVVSSLVLMGVVKSTLFFSGKDEAKFLGKLNSEQKKALFKALKDGTWKDGKIPDDLFKFRDKQNEFWQIVGSVNPNIDVKKLRYGEIGKFEEGVDFKEIEKSKTEKAKAYKNLRDLLKMKEAFAKSDDKDFSTGLSFWQMMNPLNIPKLTWRTLKTKPKWTVEKLKNLSTIIKGRTKINKMKGLWKGEYGIFLGNMQILGVPDFMLRSIEKKPKKERMTAVYKLAEDVKGMYENGGGGG